MNEYWYAERPPTVVVVAPPPRVPARTFHLVMIIATCGAWVPFWFVCEIISASRRSNYARQLRQQRQLHQQWQLNQQWQLHQQRGWG